MFCSLLNNRLRKCVVTIRPSAPWYNQEVALEKNKRRRLERKWRKTKLKNDLEPYVLQCSVVNNLISNLKNYLLQGVYQGTLWGSESSTLHCKQRYQPSPNTTTSTNSFADFFTENIDTIHSTLEEKLVNVGPIDPISTRRHSQFCM